MQDVFAERRLKPMLIGAESEPFEDKDFIYELKLDGERCLAYLDKNETILINKRDRLLLPRLPELCNLHKMVKKKCVLDGELIVTDENGKPDFEEIRRRAILSKPIKIDHAAKSRPATFVAYDILFYGSEPVTDLPLMKRKELLQKVVRQESPRLAVSRIIEDNCQAFYNLVKAQGLEGIVVKKRNSIYVPSKRSKSWVKIKNWLDDEYVICGYIHDNDIVCSLVLGQYNQKGEMIYKGHVTCGKQREDYKIIASLPERPAHPFAQKVGGSDSQAIWVEPVLAATVSFLTYTPGGKIRHPIFKGLCPEKQALECQDRFC